MKRSVFGMLLAVIATAIAGSAGLAQQAPAVSGLNGKIEFDAGLLNLPSPGFVGRTAGAITLPIGNDFGLQADFTAATAPGFTLGGALHVFTRDPASHLIGGTLGLMRTPGALIFAAGPEAEFYFDNVSIEAWGGLSYARPTAGADRFRPFAIADVAYYPEPNWRLSLGLSSLDGYNAVHAGTEYLFDGFDLPVSLTADARLGQDGAILATIGLRAYFGGPNKSLLRRHREDDPADRGASLYAAAGGVTVKPAATGAPAPGGGDDPAPPTGTCKNPGMYSYSPDLGYCQHFLTLEPEP